MRTKILFLGLICLFLLNCHATLSPHLKKDRINYVQTHPELSDKIKQAILNGDVLIGMTVEQVIASRGKPFDINRTTGSWGVHEQWVMHSDQLITNFDMIFHEKELKKIYEYWYIYFENGKVTGWQSK